jgi:RNA recognition motif-containing protein
MTTQKKNVTTIFVSGLPEEADDDAIRRHFERIDKTISLRSINIRRDFQTYKSKGVATIELASSEDGKAILIYK